MINCELEDDGSITISWDENDPVERILNTWTEQDFINVIEYQINHLEEE